MSNIQTLYLQGEDGETYRVYIESRDIPLIYSDAPSLRDLDDTSDREVYGFSEESVVKLKEIHATIRAYAWYTIGAFKNFGGAEIEEMSLKFGLKIGGKAGIPIITEGSAEGNFEIQIKCRFPK